jgi:hypothetical protein
MRKLLLVCAATALLGCGGDSTGPVASAEGDGTSRPSTARRFYTIAFIASPVYRLEIVSDVFVVHGNGTYDETFTSRETQGSQVTTTDEADNGTWVQNNASLTITASDGTVSTAAISGNTITANLQGQAVVYRRH